MKAMHYAWLSMKEEMTVATRGKYERQTEGKNKIQKFKGFQRA